MSEILTALCSMNRLSLPLFISYILHGLPPSIVNLSYLHHGISHVSERTRLGLVLKILETKKTRMAVVEVEYWGIHATTSSKNCRKTLPSILGADTPCASLSIYYISLVLHLRGPLVYMGTKECARESKRERETHSCSS